MTADVDAKDFLFISEKLFLFKLLQCRIRHIICMLQLLIPHIKQRHLTGHGILFFPVYTVQHALIYLKLLPPISLQSVKGSCLNEILNGTFVDLFAGETAHKILHGCETACPFPFLHNIIDHTGTNAFNRRKSITYPAVRHGKITITFIYIRRQDLNIHSPALHNILDDLICIFFDGRQQRSHKLHRMIAL